MQPALSTRNRRLFNRRPSLLWKICKVVQKYSIIIAFLPRHHKPQLLILNRAAGHSHASETGHSIARPIACGNRVPPQRTVLRETTVTPGFIIYARRLLGKYNLCTVQRIAALGTALQPERAADFAALSELAEQLDADGVCCRVSQLAVNGRDLMAAGVPAGPGIRKVLEALLDGVIREEYPNERQALLAAVQQLAAS